MITQAIILAAGFGRRLRPLTDVTPKPLISVGHTTCLDETIQRLHKQGIKKIIVNTHHLADQIHHHLQKYPEIVVSFEPEILETGGGIANVLPFFGDQPFFSINADIWWWENTVSPLKRLAQAWDANLMDMLLLLVRKDQAIGYYGLGDYHKDAQNRLQRPAPLAPADYVFPGIQILSSAVFKKSKVWPCQKVFSLTKIFAEAEQRQRLYGLEHDGLWADIGSLQGLEAARQAIINP